VARRAAQGLRRKPWLLAITTGIPHPPFPHAPSATVDACHRELASVIMKRAAVQELPFKSQSQFRNQARSALALYCKLHHTDRRGGDGGSRNEYVDTARGLACCCCDLHVIGTPTWACELRRFLAVCCGPVGLYPYADVRFISATSTDGSRLPEIPSTSDWKGRGLLLPMLVLEPFLAVVSPLTPGVNFVSRPGPLCTSCRCPIIVPGIAVHHFHRRHGSRDAQAA